jgi:hypothetical protein
MSWVQLEHEATLQELRLADAHIAWPTGTIKGPWTMGGSFASRYNDGLIDPYETAITRALQLPGEVVYVIEQRTVRRDHNLIIIGGPKWIKLNPYDPLGSTTPSGRYLHYYAYETIDDLLQRAGFAADELFGHNLFRGAVAAVQSYLNAHRTTHENIRYHIYADRVTSYCTECESSCPRMLFITTDHLNPMVFHRDPCDTCAYIEATVHCTENTGEQCSDCYWSERSSCYSCGEIEFQDDMYYSDYENAFMCGSCWRGEPRCSDCGRVYRENEDMCPACDTVITPPIAGSNASRILNGWDHKPHFFFWPPVPENSKLYLGAEVETSFPSTVSARNEVIDWYTKHADVFENLVYIKTDSTVHNGFEINTHPMQYEWAKENFPFSAFDELVDVHLAYPTHTSCGGHIHLNKDAFSDAHMWKFLKVHLVCGSLLGALGGRGATSQWGSFSEMQSPEGDTLKVIAKKKYHDGLWNRYVAVNLNPEFSVELRYPAGGTSATLFRKNLELAQALYDFSHKITIPQIQKGILRDQGYLLDWILRREEKYPHLVAYTNNAFPQRKDSESL